MLALIMMKTNDKETVLLTCFYHVSCACQSLIGIEYIRLPIRRWHVSSDRAQTCISVFILQCQEILVCLYISCIKYTLTVKLMVLFLSLKTNLHVFKDFCFQVKSIFSVSFGLKKNYYRTFLVLKGIFEF